MSLANTKQQLLSLADNLDALAEEVGNGGVRKTASAVDFGFDFGSVSPVVTSGASAEQKFLASLFGRDS